MNLTHLVGPGARQGRVDEGLVAVRHPAAHVGDVLQTEIRAVVSPVPYVEAVRTSYAPGSWRAARV